MTPDGTYIVRITFEIRHRSGKVATHERIAAILGDWFDDVIDQGPPEAPDYNSVLDFQCLDLDVEYTTDQTN